MVYVLCIAVLYVDLARYPMLKFFEHLSQSAAHEQTNLPLSAPVAIFTVYNCIVCLPAVVKMF